MKNEKHAKMWRDGERFFIEKMKRNKIHTYVITYIFILLNNVL